MRHIDTIKKLHEQFPEWDLDTIIKVMDCIVDDVYIWSYKDYNDKNTLTTYPKITC